MRKPPSSMKIYSIVGQRVARRRLEVHSSQTDLAKRCNLVRGTIANIESARQHPTLHTLFAIATALDADVHELLPTRSELAQYSRELVAPGLTNRMKRVAGDSVTEVADFISSRVKDD